MITSALVENLNLVDISDKSNKDFKSTAIIVYNENNKGKYLSIITTIDRIGKIDSVFEVGILSTKDIKIKTSYLNIALEYYNSIVC